MEKRTWRKRDIIWFPVETASLAKRAVKPCMLIAGLYSFTWSPLLITTFFTKTKYGNWGIVYAIFWILVFWGLLKMRREAAIAGLIAFLSGIVTDWGNYYKMARYILMSYFYIQAVRGTFSYRHLEKVDSSRRSE